MERGKPKAMDVAYQLTAQCGTDPDRAVVWQRSLMEYAGYDLDLMERAIARAAKTRDDKGINDYRALQAAIDMERLADMAP